VDDLVGAMRIAERKLLCSTGFMNLHDMGWDWDLLAKIEKKLQLHKEVKWMTPDCQGEISIDPLSTVKCVEPPRLQSRLTGRQLAQQFLINRSVLSVFCFFFFPLLI
jgi:hypothetical protein